VAGQRVADWHLAGGPIAIDALDPQYVPSGAPASSPGSADRLLDEAVARGEAVNVSANLVLHLGAQVGDTLTLDTPSGPVALPIAGVTAEFLSPRGTIQMSRALYADHWHDDTVTLVYVRVAPGADLAAVQARIGHDLARAYRLHILSWGEFVAYCAAQVRRA